MDTDYIANLIECLKSRYPDLLLTLHDSSLLITDQTTRQSVSIPLEGQLAEIAASCDAGLVQNWLISIIDLVSLNLTAFRLRDKTGRLMTGYIQAISRVDNPLNTNLSIDGEDLRNNYGWYQDGMLAADPFLSLDERIKGQSHNRDKAIARAKKRLVRGNYPLHFVDPCTGFDLPHYSMRLSGLMKADRDGAQDFLGQPTCNIIIGEALYCVLLNRFLTHKDRLGSLNLLRAASASDAAEQQLDAYLDACYDVHMAMIYKSLMSSRNRYAEIQNRLFPRLLALCGQQDARVPFYTYKPDKSDTICCWDFLKACGTTIPDATDAVAYIGFFGKADADKPQPSHAELITRFYDFRCEGGTGDYMEFTSIGAHREDAYPVRYRVMYGRCVPVGAPRKANVPSKWHIRRLLDFAQENADPALEKRLANWRSPNVTMEAYELDMLRILPIDAAILDQILGF